MSTKRRKKSYFNKGRQTDKTSLQEVEALIGEKRIQRDLLIEYLHLKSTEMRDDYHKSRLGI